MEKQELIIYEIENSSLKVEVNVKDESVWLTQKQMAELFDKDSDTIGIHVGNIYEEGELEQNSTTEEFSVVQKEGNREVRRKLN